jgi:glycosyltransferase involved in cell wall biosynthesis
MKENELRQSRSTTDPLKVCMVTAYPPRVGGIATYASELIRAIKRYGHTVEVISHPDAEVGEHENQKNVYGLMDIQRTGWERIVFKKIQELQPDVVHIQHEYDCMQLKEIMECQLSISYFSCTSIESLRLSPTTQSIAR